MSAFLKQGFAIVWNTNLATVKIEFVHGEQ